MNVNLKRLAAAGVLAATASVTVLAGSASAATEKACSGSYFCNWTYGDGTYVQYLDAYRGSGTKGKYGFFEVFGPNGFKVTGSSGTADSQRFPFRKSFPSGLLCLRFFEVVGGQATERGSAACTSIPIG
ncbi:hypothetical protein ABJI51_40470 [Amycolatopsis sp. NEAU-NG30]|uniref:Peptidase inhibitor family I36 n=1 Tax=Amycolatopsis melonis TaxID=3156488 RepID=A0ABV0LSV7_9PSEU